MNEFQALKDQAKQQLDVAEGILAACGEVEGFVSDLNAAGIRATTEIDGVGIVNIRIDLNLNDAPHELAAGDPAAADPAPEPMLPQELAVDGTADDGEVTGVPAEVASNPSADEGAAGDPEPAFLKKVAQLTPAPDKAKGAVLFWNDERCATVIRMKIAGRTNNEIGAEIGKAAAQSALSGPNTSIKANSTCARSRHRSPLTGLRISRPFLHRQSSAGAHLTIKRSWNTCSVARV